MLFSSNVQYKGLLAVKNKHERDKLVKFYDFDGEEGHKYYINGSKKDVISSTGLYGKHFKEFDEDEAISKMKTGETPGQIKARWEKARNDGSAMHENIEKYYNMEPYDHTTREFELFMNFVKDHPHLLPIRTEWFICSEKHKLGGAIDMFYYNMITKRYVIADWKRCQKLPTQGFCRCPAKRSVDSWVKKHDRSECTAFGTSEITKDIEDCKFTHYVMQLNIYRLMLKKYYRIVVDEMFLVVLHPDQENYRKMDVPVWEEPTREMFRWRLKELAEIKAKRKENKKLDCVYFYFPRGKEFVADFLSL